MVVPCILLSSLVGGEVLYPRPHLSHDLCLSISGVFKQLFRGNLAGQMILGLHVSGISLKNVLPYPAIITPLPGRTQTQDKGLLQGRAVTGLH